MFHIINICRFQTVSIKPTNCSKSVVILQLLHCMYLYKPQAQYKPVVSSDKADGKPSST